MRPGAARLPRLGTPLVPAPVPRVLGVRRGHAHVEDVVKADQQTVHVKTLEDVAPVLERWHSDLRSEIEAYADQKWPAAQILRWLDSLKAEAIAKQGEFAQQLKKVKGSRLDDVILAMTVGNQWLCIIDEEYRRLWDVLALTLAKAQEWERTGRIESAVLAYEALLREEFDATLPYDRLRILYSKQSRWADAVRVCDAYLHLPDRAKGQDKARFRKQREELVRKQNRTR